MRYPAHNNRPKRCARGRGHSGGIKILAALGFLLFASSLFAPARANTVRVTTWNLEAALNAPAGKTNELSAIANTVKELNPDVLVVQGVRDWAMCAQLAQALKPANYQVAVCSAFPGASITAGTHGEVAILSKQSAYFAWAEPWRATVQGQGQGGFAFAAVQFGKQRLGCFSFQISASAGPGFTPQQMLDQIDVARHWEANRVDAFLIAGRLIGADTEISRVKSNLVAPFQQQEYSDVVSRGAAATPHECLLVDSAAIATHLQTASSSAPSPVPITCEIELDPATVAAARSVMAERLSPASPGAPVNKRDADSRPAPDPAAATPARTWATFLWRRWWVFGAAAVIIVGSATFRMRRIQSRRRFTALIPANFDATAAGSGALTVVIASSSVTGSASKPPRQPMMQLETAATTQTQSAAWQRRALAAEDRAERAHEAIRRGVLPHLRRWLKLTFAQRLIRDRSELLAAQHSAARKALAVDERLARIEAHVREQNVIYERRVEELTRELGAAKEENRELIRARIAQIKQEMEAARARLLAESEQEELD